MLHGDIRINDAVLGEWTASRVGEHNGFVDYDCTLLYYDNEGYLNEAHWFMRAHHEKNGALSLAERVLREGMVRLRRHRVEDS